MKKLLSISILSFGLSMFLQTGVEAAATPTKIQFDDLKTHVDGTDFTAALAYKGAFNESAVDVAFVGESFQIDIPQASFPKGKYLVRTNGKVVKSIYVYQPKADVVRMKITLNSGFFAAGAENTLKFSKENGVFSVGFDAQIQKSAKDESAKPEYSRSFEFAGVPANADAAVSVSDDIIEQARLVARADDGTAKVVEGNLAEDTKPSGVAVSVASTDAKQADVKSDVKLEDTALVNDSAALVAEQSKKLKEDQIPLALEKSSKKAESQPWIKMLTTLGVLAVLLGGASFGLKKWSKKNQNKNLKNTKIKVLTQHHLGPKKSIMIVQVAGESILLGVTDHNISMIKTLALLDEEVPELAQNASFKGALSDAFVEENATFNSSDSEIDAFALRGLSEIQDKVSTRLKNMRQI